LLRAACSVWFQRGDVLFFLAGFIPNIVKSVSGDQRFAEICGAAYKSDGYRS